MADAGIDAEIDASPAGAGTAAAAWFDANGAADGAAATKEVPHFGQKRASVLQPLLQPGQGRVATGMAGASVIKLLAHCAQKRASFLFLAWH